MVSPTLGPITRTSGIAGQFGFTVALDYPDEPTMAFTFTSSIYGGPVVMITGAGTQTIVSEPGRFGTFSEDWVRRFFGFND